MKPLLSLLFSLLAVSSIHAQGISPVPDNEYCPFTENTFTVTLPAAYTSLSTTGGAQITQSPYGFNQTNTSFNFKAKFNDVNQTQVLQ